MRAVFCSDCFLSDVLVQALADGEGNSQPCEGRHDQNRQRDCEEGAQQYPECRQTELEEEARAAHLPLTGARQGCVMRRVAQCAGGQSPT